MSEGSSSLLNVKSIQIDPLVIMKIVKHTHDEGEELAQGGLVGVCIDGVLEITNSFILPNITKQANAELDFQTYQAEILKMYREVYFDYMQVGFYQSVVGATINTMFIQSLYDYYLSSDVVVALIYDQTKIASGFLHFKAYRLTEEAIKLMASEDMDAQIFAQNKVIYSDLLEELPIKIKSSCLVKLLLSEIEEACDLDDLSETSLNVNTPVMLEKNLIDLISKVELSSQNTLNLGMYARQLQRYTAQKNALIQERNRENEERHSRGEPLLSDDISNLLPAPVGPPRLDSLMLNAEIDQNCDDLNEFILQSAFKLSSLENGVMK